MKVEQEWITSVAAAYQWLTSWWLPESVVQKCTLASCQSQNPVASCPGLKTRLLAGAPSEGGKLSSIAMGFKTPASFKENRARGA